MKKTLILLAALLLLCFFTACSERPTSGNGSAIEADGTATTSTTDTTAEVTATTADKPIVEDTYATGSPESKNASCTNSTRTSSIGTAECVHDYTTKIIAPTCTKQGYTLHTCKKCGKSYRDSYVAPRHEYGKYLCLYCGRPDPECPIYSLSAWLDKNGTLAGNGIYSSIDYKENGITYSITTNIYDEKIISFDFEKSEEIFHITLEDTHECSLYYSYNGIAGSTGLKNFAVCSSTPLKLLTFENNSSVKCSKEEFSVQMSSKIDGFMKIIQNKMLYPRTGLTLKNFGFTAY